jgi:hypothetical protein
MTRKARLGRIGVLVGLTGALVAAVPAAALADTGGASKLVPGGKQCVQQYAAYQVRGDGTATWNGAFFTLEYQGQVRDNSPSALSTGWSTEHRTSFGNFYGAGYYKFCAYNFQSTNTNVTVRIRTDGEI